ncbi:Predicted alpha-1,6-mannanase, GH76 family [Amycolatopsis sacchari]|uniref:Predicted alpha-1,6-mannanase, GH76 family n=1 Tax=Amycolatopsis sacchari TaxID=115433 RepID=A0A1I3YEG1_9PSEU|nr:glycoside hydrolase family 76 protein [Amycolatopsis sacchari]SFK30192.1 Predicted alpha-1,6-mannanase, GH76 family [Amycolatopsis sacchari]
MARKLFRAVLLTATAITATALPATATAATEPATPEPAATASATPTPDTAPPTAAAAICDRYCDARDPALSPGDRLATSASSGTRRFELHFDDGDDMGWAAVSGSAAGDQVWLDRSFDGGRTWASGSRLGNTTTPSGYSGWRTLMYNVDDWNNRGVGLLRACGQPVGGGITCTGWARTTWNAGDRRTAAATALMGFYNQGTGLFDTTGWWNSAKALTAVIDNIRVTGMGSYSYVIANTYDRNVGAQGGNFTNDYLDDTAWWGMAWVAAFDLTGDARYLTTARADADHMAAYWDGMCGGGVWWNTSRTAKNAITNALYIQLNAALHNRIDGDTTYLARARDGWAWYSASGMINSQNLVNDGLDLSTCRNDGKPVYTYNQGVPLAALTELYRATGDSGLLSRAQAMANASTTSTSLNSNGILHDPGDAPGGGGPDGPSFKGAYVRGLAQLNAALSNHPYTTYLQRQANSAYANDRNTADQYGLMWAGPLDSPDAARQQSALDLMNAA